MSKISRPDLTTDFTTFFLSSGENPNPVELSEEVLFTFPFAAPTIELRFPRFETISALVGVPSRGFQIVPENVYRMVHAVNLQHSDGAGPHFARISIRNSEDASQLLSYTTVDALDTLGRAIVRNIVVPPKWSVRLDLDAIAVGASIHGSMMFTDHNLAQPLMGLSS